MLRYEQFSVQPLSETNTNHKDTEDTEVARRSDITRYAENRLRYPQ